MTPQTLDTLINALVLLIVAISGAITAWTHWKVSQLPTTTETAKVAADLAETVKANGKGVSVPTDRDFSQKNR